ncbi:MAG TPA: hypothetical protein VHQ41_03920 [Patescibacteria group bacterium]|jgi:hypothetical protein|nr:hypothetical protein [Patescibacteria group bacterium]
MRTQIRFGLMVILLACSPAFSQEYQKGLSARYVVVPAKYALLIKQHLLLIHKNGWGETVPGDLYHAHLVMSANNSSSDLISVEQLFKQSAAIFYHSDEMLDRWAGQDDKLPLSQRRPRSLLGYWSGSILPAATLFKNPEKTSHYIYSGTIHTDELAHERPNEFAPRRDYAVLAADGQPCNVNLIIDIYYSSQRPATIELGGREYTLSMDCT